MVQPICSSFKIWADRSRLYSGTGGSGDAEGRPRREIIASVYRFLLLRVLLPVESKLQSVSIIKQAKPRSCVVSSLCPYSWLLSQGQEHASALVYDKALFEALLYAFVVKFQRFL